MSGNSLQLREAFGTNEKPSAFITYLTMAARISVSNIDSILEHIRKGDSTLKRLRKEPEAAAGSSDPVDNGKDASEGAWSMNMIYGELTPSSVWTALQLASESAGSSSSDSGSGGRGLTFVDLGSGAGMPCLVAALGPWFQRVVGIELAPQLHTSALGNRAAAVEWARANELQADGGDSADSDLLARRLARMQLLLGDFLADSLPSEAEDQSQQSTTGAAVSVHPSSPTDGISFDWTTADVVFANATCFDDTLRARLIKRAEGIRRGGVLIITSHKVDSHAFSLKHELLGQASTFGTASVRIYQRSAPRWMAGLALAPRSR